MSHVIQGLNPKTFTKVVKETEKIKRNFWPDVEFYRYGIVAMILLFQSCIGSLGVIYAVHFDGMLSMIILTVVVVANFAANAMCLAMAPMKTIFWFGGVSIVISIVAIAMGLILL